MCLRYLAFDYTDASDGIAAFEALASLHRTSLPLSASEVMAVVEWATQTFPNARGPLDEGSDWDCALQATPALLALLPPEEQAQATECEPEYGPQGQEWHTLSLTLTGGPAFADAFRERFGL